MPDLFLEYGAVIMIDCSNILASIIEIFFDVEMNPAALINPVIERCRSLVSFNALTGLDVANPVIMRSESIFVLLYGFWYRDNCLSISSIKGDIFSNILYTNSTFSSIFTL